MLVLWMKVGWFEPFRDAILKEHELCGEPKNKQSHGPYFDCLPAEKMAVITMHKLMSLLMTESGVRVVQAACQVGEAVEQEIHGAKQQCQAIKRAPREIMQSVFEMGNHAKLVQKGDLYARLAKRQAGAFE